MQALKLLVKNPQPMNHMMYFLPAPCFHIIVILAVYIYIFSIFVRNKRKKYKIIFIYLFVINLQIIFYLTVYFISETKVSLQYDCQLFVLVCIINKLCCNRCLQFCDLVYFTTSHSNAPYLTLFFCVCLF